MRKKAGGLASYVRNPAAQRLALFVGVVYVAIPLLFSFLSKNISPPYKFNFGSFSLFTLLLLGLFIVYNKGKFSNVALQDNNVQVVGFTVVATILFTLSYWLRYTISIKTFSLYPGAVIILSYLTYFGAAVFVAFGLFKLQFFAVHKRSLLITGIVTYIFFMFTSILWNVWQHLSKVVTVMVSSLLSLTYPQVFAQAGKGSPLLSVEGFSAIIGQPCSGVESLSMFTGLFILAAAYDWEKVNLSRVWLLLPFGLIGMFLVNVLRVYLIMIVGVYKPGLALDLFHSNLGWIFFVGYALAFAFYAYPRMLK